jgi:TRAP-type C4-dicarboxylate transport system permease small subunit
MQMLHRLTLGYARALAALGGVVLAGLIVMVCVSILGRALNTALYALIDMGAFAGLAQALLDLGVSAVRGDFELVEAGMAFCIFAFLPYCQITKGHAAVDVLTPALPKSLRRGSDLLIAFAFALALVVIAMQLNEGLARKMRSGQSTILLGLPIWWAYAACLVGAVSAAATASVVALTQGLSLLTGHPMPDQEPRDEQP